MQTKLFLLLNRNFASLDISLQEEVYRDFYHLVYNIAIYMTKDHGLAEDIVQEAFIKTIFKAPLMENEQQLRAWIKVVTKNLTLNVLKQNKNIIYSKDIELVINSEVNSHVEAVDKEVVVKIFEDNINNRLAEINPDYRMLIEMKWKGNKSDYDIARKLNVSEGAIRQKLFRARKALRMKILRWIFENE